MKKHKLPLTTAVFLLGSSILACNFSTATSGAIEPPASTLSPPPAADFQLENPFADSPYFLEEFSSSLPDGWETTPDWAISAGRLSSRNQGAMLDIPGEYQEIRVILNLQVRSSTGSLDFNISPAGAYRLTFSADQLSISWHPVGEEQQNLATAPADLGAGWHVLILNQSRGMIAVELNGETVISGLRPEFSPLGSLRLIHHGNSLLEIDRLVVAPPNP